MLHQLPNGTGDFIIAGARLFLKWPILIVKPTYVEKNRAEKWKLKSMNLSVQEKI